MIPLPTEEKFLQSEEGVRKRISIYCNDWLGFEDKVAVKKTVQELSRGTIQILPNSAGSMKDADIWMPQWQIAKKPNEQDMRANLY